METIRKNTRFLTQVVMTLFEALGALYFFLLYIPFMNTAASATWFIIEISCFIIGILLLTKLAGLGFLSALGLLLLAAYVICLIIVVVILGYEDEEDDERR
jgi:hypothetical protein